MRPAPIALALLGLLSAVPARALARCLGQVNGPCNTPEPVSFFPGAAADPVVITNFGLLYPGSAAGSWQLICDDLYGLALPAGLRRSADGRIYAGAGEGLRFSSDGCSWSDGGGAAAGQAVLDIAVDTAPGLVWVLAELPPRVLRSDDGGAQFTLVHAFDPGQPLPYHRLVAGGDGLTLYLFGRGSNGSTPAAVSADGGQTFSSFDLSTRGPAPPAPLELLAAAPGDSRVLYFQAFDPRGDQLWRTTDGGATVAPVLRLATGEILGGFSFGADARTVFVGGMNPFPAAGVPPGHLHVSRDGGTTWAAPLPSPATGPRYRCLTHAGGKLYACGAGEILGDAFMVAVSTDEGHSWQPHVRMRDIDGARGCAKARCLATETWLCELHGQCASDAGAPPFPPDAGPDGAADAAGTPGRGQDGCGCALGGTSRSGGPAPLGALLALGLLLAAVRRPIGRSRWPRARRSPH